jgi:hypothetical protein
VPVRRSPLRGSRVQSPVEAFVLEGRLMGGTSISWRPASAAPSTPQLTSGWGREGTVVVGVWPLGTLLGPEGVAAAAISGDSTVDEPPAPGCLPLRGVGGVRGGVGSLWGASRFLRTAQWTRASLSMSL